MNIKTMKVVVQTSKLTRRFMRTTPIRTIIFFQGFQLHSVKEIKCNSCHIENYIQFFNRKENIHFIIKRFLNVSKYSFSKNYYEVLGIPKTASQKEIKNAYYKLAMIHHPDKNGGISTAKFREIKEAYDFLSVESNRMKYNNDFHNYTNPSNSYSNSSSNWNTNSSTGRYTSSGFKKKSSFYDYNYSYNYKNLKPYNVYINIIIVPKRVIKTQVDIMLLTFVRNRILKSILFFIFETLWNQVLKNINFNILIPNNIDDNIFVSFLSNLLGYEKVCINLTESEAIMGKAVRIKVREDQQVLVVSIPKNVRKDQSFILFCLNDEIKNTEFKT
ncbi:uncharacterized protein LOC126902321 [Daktulosphaira vitifoliae]|uniref:uncharacterized protein LOC126902321 n=1 Tax=Daktulosphaira vitifoliae TaxID=58002 RepID=UPI0021AA09A8|nr:uncharacterized protein LOC126902321 [Daktulosphaira vitifoliae]XP_050535410.1 uncharacterized protein LOC126902321 [Daktulosphaira vitifoliae]